MYSDSKSEDVWTSLMLHEAGWQTIYIPTALAIGDTPETIEAYTKQQLRWATGGFEIMLTHNPLSRKRNLTLDQRLQYFVTATHYLTGIAPAAAAAGAAAADLLRPDADEPDVTSATWLLYYAGLLRHADPRRVLHPRLVPLGDADARGRVVPDLRAGAGQRDLNKDQKWHVTGAAEATAHRSTS